MEALIHVIREICTSPSIPDDLPGGLRCPSFDCHLLLQIPVRIKSQSSQASSSPHSAPCRCCWYVGFWMGGTPLWLSIARGNPCRKWKGLPGGCHWFEVHQPPPGRLALPATSEPLTTFSGLVSPCRISSLIFPSSPNPKAYLSLYSLVFPQLHWDITNNKNCIFARYTTWWFDIHIHYEMILQLS